MSTSQASLRPSRPPTSSKEQPPPLPSPPETVMKAPQLPVSRRVSQRLPAPTVITNNDLVAERNGDSRTMKSATPPLLSPPFGAVELSVVPPTRAGDDSSGSRSISPIEEEPWSTPGTEYSSDSRFRRRSDTALWTPQSVSQGRNYRASCHVDRFGGVSPRECLHEVRARCHDCRVLPMFRATAQHLHHTYQPSCRKDRTVPGNDTLCITALLSLVALRWPKSTWPKRMKKKDSTKSSAWHQKSPRW